MSAPASGRFIVSVGRMTSYRAEIDAADEATAQSIAKFLIAETGLFDLVFREEHESLEVLTITGVTEATS